MWRIYFGMLSKSLYYSSCWLLRRGKTDLIVMLPPDMQETKPHIQDLSVKTTIISRYAFTAVSCTMVNRHSAATKGVFQFQIPTTAYVSNFTMWVHLDSVSDITMWVQLDSFSHFTTPWQMEQFDSSTLVFWVQLGSGSISTPRVQLDNVSNCTIWITAGEFCSYTMHL